MRRRIYVAMFFCDLMMTVKVSIRRANCELAFFVCVFHKGSIVPCNIDERIRNCNALTPTLMFGNNNFFVTVCDNLAGAILTGSK